MCCFRDKKVEARIRRKARRGWFIGWKVLLANSGVSTTAFYAYKPGTHARKLRRYSEVRPSGFHVYLSEADAKAHLGDYMVAIPMRCPVKEMLRAGYGTCCPADDSIPQAVFRRIHISKKDWIAAGLPLPKVRRELK